MSCFLYFAKDTKTLPDCLSYAFEDQPAVNPITGQGVEGCHGAIFCLDAGKGRYLKDAQTWLDVPKMDCKLGWYTDSQPKPEDLARKKQIDGHWVELGDGQKWLVPMARRFVKEGTEYRYVISLPQVIALNDEGQWVMGAIRQQFQELEQIASRYWDHRYSDDRGKVMTDEEFVSSAAKVLGYNYRVRNIEISALELFDETTVKPVLDALIDEPTLERHIAEEAADDEEKKSSE